MHFLTFNHSSFNSFSPTDLDITNHRFIMIVLFNAKHFDEENNEGAPASFGTFVPGTQARSVHVLPSLRTPDTLKDDQIIDNPTTRSSLAKTFATDKSDESRDATGIEARPRHHLNTGEVKADRTHIDETGSMVRVID